MVNTKFLVVFLIICKFFALVSMSTKSNRIKYYKAYSLLIVLLVISNFCFYTVHILFKETFSVLNSVYKFIDYLVYFFESLAIVILILVNIFYRPNKLRNIFKKLKNFDNFIGIKGPLNFWTIFITLNLLISFVIIYQPLLCLRDFPREVCVPYIGRVVLWYYKTLTVMLLYVLAKEMKVKFESLNDLLMRTGSKLSGNFGGDFKHASNLAREKKAALKRLGRIKNLYDELCGIVDDYNEVFGVTLLSYTLVTISNILLWTIAAIYSDILEYKLISALWLIKTIVSFK